MASMEVMVVFPWQPATPHHGFIALGKLPQGLAAFQLRDAQLSCPDPFGIVCFDGGAVDDQVGAFHVFSRLADGDWDAQLGQPLGKGGGGAVAAPDGIASGGQHLGQPVHGTTADADKVDDLVVGDVGCGLGHGITSVKHKRNNRRAQGPRRKNHRLLPILYRKIPG